MTAPDWLADAVFYEILPERFANGDPRLDPPGVEPWDAAPTRENFLGGDLQGIVDHLDHILALGANALYLTPVFQAGTNHRYDATDYFSVDHRLGDLAAFRRLIDAAHARGVRVVLDAVFNHCGDGHWAFRDVVENEADSKFVNWFFVEGFPVASHPEPNYRTCSGCAYLPQWNAYNPEVRDHHYRVVRYWMDQGIDGWRLDVPYFVNDTFWRGFRDVVKAIREDAYIVAEEWRRPDRWLRGDTADGTMNYTLRDLVLGFTADRTVDAHGLAAGLNTLTESIPDAHRRAMLNLLGSHDTERVLTRHHGDAPAAVLAYTLLVTAQGAPMIYYGDEIGMTGENDPGCRGGMVWDESRWDHGLSATLRGLLALRTASSALRRGACEYTAIDDDTVQVTRTHASERTVVIVHRSSGTAVHLPAPPTGTRWRTPDGRVVSDRAIASAGTPFAVLSSAPGTGT